MAPTLFIAKSQTCQTEACLRHVPKGDNAMSNSKSGGSWLAHAIQRLSHDGFSVLYNVQFTGQKFEAVAHRSGFELMKFGNSETFFVFGELVSADANSVRRFSSQAFQYAKKSRTCPLPCGLFESVCCFAICIAKGLDEPTADQVRKTAPAKHWAAAEIPVIYDSSQGKLYFFEKTPLWGAAYYKGFRTQINKYLAVSEGDLRGVPADMDKPPR
jgi:hypothetical protein